jgi:hypothetical protein
MTVLGHLNVTFVPMSTGSYLRQLLPSARIYAYPSVGAYMPQVTIKTGIAGPDGREEELTEYLCDWPGCPNIAAHVRGCVKELGLSVVVCEQHVATSRNSSH